MTARLVKGRTLTAWQTVQDDLELAGANVRDEPVVIDATGSPAAGAERRKKIPNRFNNWISEDPSRYRRAGSAWSVVLQANRSVADVQEAHRTPGS
jgi:hypothetical protein